MGRIFLWLLLGAVAWWLLKPRRHVTPPGAARKAAPVETMVDCARCGVHLPSSDALRDGRDRAYCCAAHRDAGPRDGR